MATKPLITDTIDAHRTEGRRRTPILDSGREVDHGPDQEATSRQPAQPQEGTRKAPPRKARQPRKATALKKAPAKKATARK